MDDVWTRVRCVMDIKDIIEQLRRVRTPIVYDVVETFNVRPRNEGWMDTSIKSLLPSLGVMVGYACTGKVIGEMPPVDNEPVVEWKEVWKYVASSPKPSVMVVQDIDAHPARSCAWGDVAASIFLKLGSVGTVTDGGVRDIREVEELGFHLFAPSPVVGHSYIRFVEINTPVTVGSITVRPGDLIHGDEQGVVVIPKEIPLDELIRRIPKFLASEKTIIDFCKEKNFSIDGLCKKFEEHDKRMGGHFS
jgi:4-hydroxy-4-methyl-2-oxoglutarate aldolase